MGTDAPIANLIKARLLSSDFVTVPTGKLSDAPRLLSGNFSKSDVSATGWIETVAPDSEKVQPTRTSRGGMSLVKSDVIKA